MKWSKFNKIGDTCYRVKNQINGYTTFAKWFLSTNGNGDMQLFAEWTKKEGIYEYRIKNNHYFKNILNNALHKYKVIKKIKGKYLQNFNDESQINDILNNLTKTEGLNNKLNIETCKAFRETLNFMIKNPSLNNAKKIFCAFSVYEEGDNFFDLYDCPNIFMNIARKILVKNTPEKILRKNLLSRKPSNELKKMCSNIIKNQSMFKIELHDFQKLKKHYLWPFTNHVEFNNFIRNNDFKNIVLRLLSSQKEHLLLKEYFDLFNRVMRGLNLASTIGQNVKFYLNKNLNFNNNSFSSTSINKIQTYPCTHEEVNEYLLSIQKENYDFCDHNLSFNGIKRSIIAEYLVNIKFCYLFKINSGEIGKYVNTCLNEKLCPVACASGKKSDMNYYDIKTLWSIETTIHDTVGAIINHECRPCISHLQTFKPNKMQNILLLIQPKGINNEIIDWFESRGRELFKREGKNFYFKTFNFEQLSKINEIRSIFSS